MKPILALISAVALGAVLMGLYAQKPTEDDLDSQFQSFITEHRKSYFSATEYNLRKSIFAQNLDTIEKMNAEDDKAEFGVNQFADLTIEEFSRRLKVPGKGLSEEDRDDKVDQEAYPTREWATTLDW